MIGEAEHNKATLEAERVPFRLEHISMRFGGLDALRDVSLSILDKGVTGVIGPNGAGKTTLFNIATGFIAPTAGRVLMNDRDVTGHRPDEFVRMGVARTFQNIRLFRRMNVLENVLAGALARRGLGWRGLVPSISPGDTARLSSQARDLLARVGMRGREHAMVSRLPYGQQRRVEIARALATMPSILLLDEPSAGMNPSEADELAQLIRSFRDDGTSVVLIEHNMRLVMDLSDRIAVLNFGAKIAEGTASEITQDPDVVAAYLGQP